MLALMIGGTNTAVRALTVEGNNYIVSSDEEFRNAVLAINCNPSGEYSITLAADITVGGGRYPELLKIESNSVTIYGEDHTLYLANAYIVASNKATLCLGSSSYSKSLFIKDRATAFDGSVSLIYINDATLNMYNGVILSGRQGYDAAGGVQMERATFNMYGGEILDCKSDSVAGGVLAYDNSQFNMSGGTIENCIGNSGGGISVIRSRVHMKAGTIKGCIAYNSGGGILASTESKIAMEGGTIEECGSGYYGGGVHLTGNSEFSMTDGAIKCTNSIIGGAGVCVGVAGVNHKNSFVMTGGEITGCETESDRYGYGGGVLVMNGSAQITGSSKVYDNHASAAGDDILSYGPSTGSNPTSTGLKFGSVPEGLVFAGTSHEIDGWYVDGVADGAETDRWDIDSFVQKYDPSPETAIETQIALKAAYGEHDWEWVTDQEATCEKTGLKHEECKNCRKKQNENTVIDALGHDWGEPAFSLKDDGSAEATFTCETVSSHTETVEAKLSGEPSLVKPTKTEDGKLTYNATVTHDGKEYKGTLEKVIPNAGGDIKYSYTGEPATYTKGSGQTVELRFSRSEFDEYTYNFFTELKTDHVSVDESNYTTKEGSVIITLSADYLDTLTEGDRLVAAEFTDGSAEVILTVRDEYALVGFATSDHTTVSENYFKFGLGSEYVLPTLEEAEKIAGIDLGDGELDYWEIWKFRPQEETEDRNLQKRWGEGSIGDAEDGAATCEKGQPGDKMILTTDIVLAPVFKEVVPATGVKDHIAMYSCLMIVSIISIAALLEYRKKNLE